MPSPGPLGAVIFDLDGTLVQTRQASWRIFEKVSAAHDLGITTPEQFYELFANNFFVSLHALCRDAEHARSVEDDFMLSLGAEYAPLMIPGMVDVVKALVPHATLAVLSSNSTEVIRRILKQNGLAFCFSHVFGGDVEPDKAKGIRRFLDDAAQGSGRRCEAFYDESPIGPAAPPGSTAIITDTVGDVEAAVAAGIRAVGVAWGMHTEEQLLAAGAEFVAIWPQEILAHLLSGAASDNAGDACQAPPTLAAQPRAADSAPARVQRRISGAATMQAQTSLSQGTPTPATQHLDSLPGPGQPVAEPAPKAPPQSRLAPNAIGSEAAHELLRAVAMVMS